MSMKSLPSGAWTSTLSSMDAPVIATRYDRMAKNFLAAVCLAATISYRL
jgi:hypothetical protein